MCASSFPQVGGIRAEHQQLINHPTVELETTHMHVHPSPTTKGFLFHCLVVEKIFFVAHQNHHFFNLIIFKSSQF